MWFSPLREVDSNEINVKNSDKYKETEHQEDVQDVAGNIQIMACELAFACTEWV